MEVYFIVDSITPSCLEQWSVLEQMKQQNPQLKVNCFVIANKGFGENVAEDANFCKWFESNRDWIQLGVHGYDQSIELKSEVERDSWELKRCLTQSLRILSPFLPSKKGYRPPDFQSSIHLKRLLQELKFDFITHEGRIQSLTDSPIRQFHLINTSLCNIQLIAFNSDTQFRFIGE